MLITYESGDVVELDDDVNVPFGMAASFIKLKQRSIGPKWTFELVNGYHDIIPSGAKIGEKWFNPA